MDFVKWRNSKLDLLNSYFDMRMTKIAAAASARFGPLVDVMRYSLEGTGKRLRPLLVLASGEYLGMRAEQILPAASAVEFIHTFSLIHDDLPGMDNDDLRRGQPSSHKKFGEALALLAGDAFLTEAFSELLGLGESGPFGAAQVLSAIETLASHTGVRGLIGGQCLDVTVSATDSTIPEVEFIHIHKTGALIRAAVLLPAKLIPLEEVRMQRLRRYGECVGLAFQISDDVLDAEPLSRYSRGPLPHLRPTLTRHMGATEIRSRLQSLIELAIANLAPEPSAQPLVQIAQYIRDRRPNGTPHSPSVTATTTLLHEK